MTTQQWLEVYSLLSKGGSIQDVIYDESMSIKDQSRVGLYFNRDKTIWIKITPDTCEHDGWNESDLTIKGGHTYCPDCEIR